jgi:fructose-1,6-bisphosphatase/inositol monophosphatase family enzyme
MKADASFKYDFLNLSLHIRDVILQELSRFPSGNLRLLETQGTDLKGKHQADEQLYHALVDFFSLQQLPANIYIESGTPLLYGKDAEFCIYIDPVDGSVNRDLGVGDPGIVIAYATGNSPRFQDVFAGYVYGLRSQDTYYSAGGKSYYQPNDSTHAVEIFCDQRVRRIQDAILYYNDGYGKEFAMQAFHKAGILPFLVKHHNAFDNAGLEICQLCRGAAHLRVEARAYQTKGRMKGSDHANILAAFAIGKGAGILVADLKGNSLDNTIIEVDRVQDFICASNEDLLQEALSLIECNQELLRDLIHPE